MSPKIKRTLKVVSRFLAIPAAVVACLTAYDSLAPAATTDQATITRKYESTRKGVTIHYIEAHGRYDYDEVGDVVAKDSDAVLANWAKLKGEEKKKKGKLDALDGVPKTAPALLRANRLGEKASAVGFDWPDEHGPREKITEELGELDAATAAGHHDGIEHKLGDVLFAVVNLARKMGLDAEQALAAANRRFEQRFGLVEQAVQKQGKQLRDMPPEQLDALWEQAKRQTTTPASQPKQGEQP